tara:strand:- start:20678 stop:20884 length:207 start_codon:yes stop_codon:yes gene_type:complete
MPNFIIIIIVVAILGWLFGYLKSGGNTTEANETGCALGAGCGYVLLQLFFAALGILVVLWVFGLIFGY